MRTKSVLFSMVSSLLLLPAGQFVAAVGTSDAEVEPGGPMGASATLVNVIDQSGQLTALVRLDLTATAVDTDVTVTPIRPEADSRKSSPSSAVRKAKLVKGQTYTMFLSSELQAGRENHLYYRVDGTGRNGSRTGMTVYLRVNLDPALEPREVGGCLEYQGAPGGGAQR